MTNPFQRHAHLFRIVDVVNHATACKSLMIVAAFSLFIKTGKAVDGSASSCELNTIIGLRYDWPARLFGESWVRRLCRGTH